MKKKRFSLENLKVPLEELRWTCDPKSLPFSSTQELKPSSKILGQGKALKALGLGLEMESPGYNIFVCGMPGTGRRTALKHALSRVSKRDKQIEDLICLPRFSTPDRLRFLPLPPGKGLALKKLIDGIFKDLTRVRDRFPDAAEHLRERLAVIKSKILPRLEKISKKFEHHKDLTRYFKKLGAEIVSREGEIFVEDFGVKLLVSRRKGQKSPVHWPSHVSFGTLFGSFEKQRGDDKHPGGIPVGSIRAGALLEARGGFLVLSANDLIESPNAWSTLKHCLMAGHLNFFDNEGNTMLLTTGMDSDAIPLQVKVILVGDYQTYDLLQEMDPEFTRAFRVRVDFDVETEITSRIIKNDYPKAVAHLVESENLKHLSATGMAKVIEYAVRRAGRKNKISVQFSAVADLIREASFWAAKKRKRLITAKEVGQTISESIDRLNLLEVKISEMISDGVILIDTDGSRVGQVNGLAVYDQGDYLFGKPSRITAETSVGSSGIINIERESGLSGRSHDKGIQILGGYLRSHFAQKRPLSLTASVCFEQSYSGVDGDSASATEIYAIISSLSGLPIRQDIAVTGSLNQKGDIQPIGGVNEKIEGFFDCVQADKPTGKEGVIIPRRNVPDLMLREDVVKAVKKKQFTIYAIDKVEEGIEILTGHHAGSRGKDGHFPKGSVFERVDCRLEEIVKGLKDYPQSASPNSV